MKDRAAGGEPTDSGALRLETFRVTGDLEHAKVHRMADSLKAYRIARRFSGPFLLATALSTPIQAVAVETEFSTAPTWQLANPDAVYRQLESYVQSLPLAPDRASKVRDLWWQTDGATKEPAALLDRLANCLGEVDERVAQLVAFCNESQRPTVLPDFSWLANSETAPLVRFNMRLYYARWLAENGYDDEAIAWTDGLRPTDVVAPDMLLFYRAVSNHRVVNADRADATVAELLQRSDELPARYQKLAELMQQDLAGLEDDSLDHIARRMADVRRRLELGRAGKTVQVVEDGVVASLDKMIKDLEDQAQQQQSRSGSSGGSPSGTPMEDSRLAELKGPGNVDQRDIGDGADWGDMPDKQREQALQDVGREFPSHYREVIEEYFRRLAAEESDAAP